MISLNCELTTAKEIPGTTNAHMLFNYRLANSVRFFKKNVLTFLNGLFIMSAMSPISTKGAASESEGPLLRTGPGLAAERRFQAY